MVGFGCRVISIANIANWEWDCPLALKELITRLIKSIILFTQKSLSLVDIGDIVGGRLLCKSWWWILQSSLSSVFLRNVRNQTKQNSNGATEVRIGLILDGSYGMAVLFFVHSEQVNQTRLEGKKGLPFFSMRTYKHYSYYTQSARWKVPTQNQTIVKM